MLGRHCELTAEPLEAGALPRPVLLLLLLARQSPLCCCCPARETKPPVPLLSNREIQVVGHVKTILVLVGGCLFFAEQVKLSQWAGTAIAITGMIIYSSAAAAAASESRGAPTPPPR